MKSIKYIILALIVIGFSNCNDYLDKEDPTKAWEDKYWTSENSLDLYANTFYPYFFSGYGYRFSTNYAPLSYTFSDDVVQSSVQTQFSFKVPTGTIEISESAQSSIANPAWNSQYAGPAWNFYWIRKANVMQDRILDRMGGVLDTDAQNHWLGVARFFRALEYARLVHVFGDIPYYDKEVLNTEIDLLYKDRTPRNEVMDAVYDDFKFALENLKLNAGALKLDRYVAASYISRWALFEGTWLKYHKNDVTRATRFLELAVEAGDMVINSGKYDIVTDFRSLFTQKSLLANKDVIFSRLYSGDLNVTHSIASSSNMVDPRTVNINLDMLKEFNCIDGKSYANSTVDNASSFNIKDMIKTRDPRFEATFYHKPTAKSKSSYIYATKFAPREALDYIKSGGTPAPEYQSDKNITSYPTMRYAEVLLNWIEAKAELDVMGTGLKVSGTDIALSINKLRNRPIAPEALAMGVQRVKDLDINNLPNDPRRDVSVPALLWEIRKERRMEFIFEYGRIVDLRRWKKLEYMDTDANEDLLMGVWVDFPADAQQDLTDANKNLLRVKNATGEVIVYDGSNASQMKGFWYTKDNKGRNKFLNVVNVNPYLSPVGFTDIRNYADKGYTLSQTEGWPAVQ